MRMHQATIYSLIWYRVYDETRSDLCRPKSDVGNILGLMYYGDMYARLSVVKSIVEAVKDNIWLPFEEPRANESGWGDRRVVARKA